VPFIMNEQRPLWTYEDVARFLRVKTETVYVWRARGRIPYIKLSPRVVRFDPDAIRDWVQSSELEAPAAE